MLIQLSGIGVLRPNVIVLGFKEDWMEFRKQRTLPPLSPTQKKEFKPLREYVGMIQDTINARMGIIIARDLQHFKWQVLDKEH